MVNLSDISFSNIKNSIDDVLSRKNKGKMNKAYTTSEITGTDGSTLLFHKYDSFVILEYHIAHANTSANWVKIADAPINCRPNHEIYNNLTCFNNPDGYGALLITESGEINVKVVSSNWVNDYGSLVYPIDTYKLPSEYQEVEWIGCDGNQYIDTGFRATTNFSIESKMMFTGADNFFFSCYNGARDILSLYVGNYQSSHGGYDISIYRGTNAYLISHGNQININEVIKETVSGTTITYNLNGVTGSTTDSRVIALNTNLILFKRGTANTYKFKGRLYYFNIIVDNVKVREFVPCYRVSDNVIGLYDLVNNTFYTNQGSGTFTKGANI